MGHDVVGVAALVHRRALDDERRAAGGQRLGHGQPARLGDDGINGPQPERQFGHVAVEVGRPAPIDVPHLGQQLVVVAGDDNPLDGQLGLIDGAQEGGELVHAAATYRQDRGQRRVPAVGGAHLRPRLPLAQAQIDGNAGHVDALGGNAAPRGQRRCLGRRHQVEIDLAAEPEALQPGQVGDQHNHRPRFAPASAIVGQQVDKAGVGSDDHIGPRPIQHAADRPTERQHFRALHQARRQGGIGQSVAKAIERRGEAHDAVELRLGVAQDGGHARLFQRIDEDGPAEVAIALLQRGHRRQRGLPVAQPGVVGQYENGATVVHNLLSVYRLRAAVPSRA